jgi:ligand-binding sensor domain-containing protein
MSSSRPWHRTSRRRRTPSRAILAGVVAVLSLGLLTMPAAGPAIAGTDAEGGSWRILKPTNTGIPGDYVYSLAVDASDRPWMTADDPIWDEGGLGEFTGKRWRQWTNVDGKAPTHQMGNLTFDAQGTAWMGSEIGLLRFDGKKVRKVWSTANAPWPTNIVADFDWDSAGNLWVALADVQTVKGGVARYDGSKWKVWTTANGLPWPSPWDQVSALEIDAQDRVWIGSPTQGGAVFEGSSWHALGNGSGTWVYDIAIAPDGTPWYGFTSTGVQTWEGSKWIDRTGPFGTDGISLVKVDREGRIWVGTFIGTIWRWSGSGSSWDLSYAPPSLGSHIYGLDFDSKNQPWVGGIGGIAVRHTTGRWDAYTTQNTALPSRWVDDVMVDSAGNGWFSTAGGGLARWDGKHWADFNPNNFGSEPWPFATDAATDAIQAPDGSIWTSPYAHGVGRWDGHQWTAYLPFHDIRSLAAAPNGTIWAGPKYEGAVVERFNGTTWKEIKVPSAYETADVTSDSAGNVWVAGYGVLRFDGKTWTQWTAENSGLPTNFVLTLRVDSSGVLWAGTTEGLARFDGQTWTVYTEANDGIPADVINSIAFAPNGHVWIGAFDAQHFPYHGGLGDFDGSTWTSYTSKNSPLPHEQVESVAVDQTGAVWMGTASEGAAIFRPPA